MPPSICQTLLKPLCFIRYAPTASEYHRYSTSLSFYLHVPQHFSALAAVHEHPPGHFRNGQLHTPVVAHINKDRVRIVQHHSHLPPSDNRRRTGIKTRIINTVSNDTVANFHAAPKMTFRHPQRNI